MFIEPRCPVNGICHQLGLDLKFWSVIKNKKPRKAKKKSEGRAKKGKIF